MAVGAAELAAALDDLGAIYRQAGVRAWTVWVPDDDRLSAELLASRGHVLDGAPRAMALELADLRPVELPAGVELVPGAMATIGAINDRAYGIEGPGWATAMIDEPDLAMESAVAIADGEPVACALVLDHGDDACVSAVATLPGHRGRGLAGAIISRLLAAAAERGIRTGSLQASRAGAPARHATSNRTRFRATRPSGGSPKRSRSLPPRVSSGGAARRPARTPSPSWWETPRRSSWTGLTAPRPLPWSYALR